MLINSEQPTHFNNRDGSQSSIDLTISSTSEADKIDWQVLDDLHDSDHYPIFININTGLYKKSYKTNSQSNITKIRNYKKANWEKYQIEINKNISLLETPKTDNKNNIDNLTEKFTEMIPNATDV